MKRCRYLLFLSAFIFSLSLHAQKMPQQGIASFYAGKFHGRLTANGERFNQWAMTAAHRKLPFNSWVKVTNLANDRSVIVRINDRGPFIKDRIIDLSKKAAQELGFIRQGVTKVRIELVDKVGRAKEAVPKLPFEALDYFKNDQQANLESYQHKKLL